MDDSTEGRLAEIEGSAVTSPSGALTTLPTVSFDALLSIARSGMEDGKNGVARGGSIEGTAGPDTAKQSGPDLEGAACWPRRSSGDSISGETATALPYVSDLDSRPPLSPCAAWPDRRGWVGSRTSRETKSKVEQAIAERHAVLVQPIGDEGK